VFLDNQKFFNLCGWFLCRVGNVLSFTWFKQMNEAERPFLLKETPLPTDPSKKRWAKLIALNYIQRYTFV